MCLTGRDKMLFMVCQTHISLETLLMPMLFFRCCLVFCFFYILNNKRFCQKVLYFIFPSFACCSFHSFLRYFQSFSLCFNQAFLHLVSNFVNRKPRGDYLSKITRNKQTAHTDKHNGSSFYRSGGWRSVGPHVMRNGSGHSCCHGNPLSRHWATSVHPSRVTTCRRKQSHSHHSHLMTEWFAGGQFCWIWLTLLKF